MSENSHENPYTECDFGGKVRSLSEGGGRTNMADIERMLRPREVALLFKVDPKTVTRWAKSGRLSPVVLPSGHRRYRMSDVETLINATSRRARPVGQHTCPRCGTSVRCSGGE